MSVRLRKKLVITGSIIIFIIVLFIIASLWHYDRFAEKGKYNIENVSINILLKTIDSTYWKNPLQSLNSVNRLINLSVKINNSDAHAMCLFYKAACYYILGQYDSTFILCNNALLIAESTKNEILLAKVKNVLANYYLVKNEYYNASKCLIESLPIFERQGRKKELCSVLNGFGLLYLDLKEPDKALPYFIRVKSLSLGLGEKRAELMATVNIANCYFYNNNIPQYLSLLQTALTGFRTINDSVHIISCYLDIGIAYMNLGSNTIGLNYLKQALSYSKRLNNKLLLGKTLYNIGVYYLNCNNLVFARKYLLASLYTYKETRDKDGEKDVLLELSKIAKIKNDWVKAYAYYINYISINDSLINEGLRKNITDLQWKYTYQKKENEIIVIRKKYEVKKKETLILTISFSFFIVVALLIGALVRLAHKNLRKSDKLKEVQIIHLQEKMVADDKINKLKKLKLQAEIEAKNKELTTSSIQLITKNDILTNISGITDSFYKKKAINEEFYINLKKILKENLDQERNWEHFKRLFEEVHKDFFKNIKLTCPEITESELRICAYLKINLQNKEIAKLLNVTPDSLKTLRCRIRKKFGLEKEAILEEYLRSI